MFYLLLLIYIIPVALIVGLVLVLVKVVIKLLLRIFGWLLLLVWIGLKYLVKGIRLAMA